MISTNKSKSNIYKALAVLFFFVFSASSAFSQEHATESHEGTTETHSTESEHHEEKFNAGELIIGHISDAHDVHLWGHTHIPLPVVLYTKERGVEVFSSSNFVKPHGSEISAPYHGYRLNKNEIQAVNDDGSVNEERTAGIWDISLTKNVVSLMVSILLMLWIFTSVAKAYTRNKDQAPKGLQSLIEPIIIFVRDDVAKASIGEKKYMKFLPFLLTAFFFIWINNLLGLIPIFPGGTNVTGNIAITMTLAVFVFLITCFSANKNYWIHVFAMPGVPKWVLFLLTPIEILGVFLRPFVLMVRLFANITAGHIIALSFFSLIFIFGEMNAGLGLGVSIFSVAFAVFMGFLELLVAFLQAYVFTLLAAIYFGAAVEEHHHDTHGHDAHVEEAAII